MRLHTSAVAAALLALAGAGQLRAQAEVRPWGSIVGMRVEGQLIPFEARLCMVTEDDEERECTAKESQLPHFVHSGATRTIATRLRGVAATETVTDAGRGVATIRARFATDSIPWPGAGVFAVALGRTDWSGARVELIGRAAGPRRAFALPASVPSDGTSRVELLRATARGIRLVLPARTLELDFGAPTPIVIRGDRRDGSDDYRVHAMVLRGPVGPRSSAEAVVTLRASGTIDHSPTTIALDLAHPGRRFEGMGGNFRVEDATLDPTVTEYNLANLRVAWGRVELPWRAWQPDESGDPSATVPDSLDVRVRRAMEMSRTLARRGIPFVVSVWFPPRWAVIGELPDARPEGGETGNALDPAKLDRIYDSLGAYLLYLKRWYGAEPAYFSFNESNLGIDVRQTPREHDAMIRGFGAWLVAHGLATKMLLGDTGDATDTAFIGATMGDTAAWRFVGAVSFHSWRGWSDSLLGFWDAAARTLGVPLLVAEASTDAGAWRYPAVFLEPYYPLEEAKVYVRVLARSRPTSILPWQLTADYSLVAGAGVFGDSSGALHPTERFWVVKQLASSPAGSFHVPARCDRVETSCAALADRAAGVYTVHVVNDGASRPATISGFPAGIGELRVYVTDATRGMAEGARVPVRDGVARLTLDPTSFTTLVGAR